MPQNPQPPLPKEPDKKTPDQELAELQAEADRKSDEKFMLGYKDVSMDDLVSKGYVCHEVKMTEKLVIKLRTLKKKEELDVKKRLPSYEGAQIYVMDEAIADTLAYSIIEINKELLPTEDKKQRDGTIEKYAFDMRKEIVCDLPDAIAVALTEELRNLNKALIIMLRGSSKNSLARRLLGQELT